jgi:hypothetical protein|tara:strand:+ start:2221 stop:2643 length:423 start_codon:yes stop_codon:yes gene_type:complete
MRLTKQILREMIREALEVHLAPEDLEEMGPEEAYGLGYYAGKELEDEGLPVVDGACDIMFEQDKGSAETAYPGDAGVPVTTSQPETAGTLQAIDLEIQAATKKLNTLATDDPSRKVTQANLASMEATRANLAYSQKNVGV